MSSSIIQYGKGLLVARPAGTTDFAVVLPEQSDMQLTVGTETSDYVPGNSLANEVIITGRPINLNAAFRGLNGRILAWTLGGTTEAGGAVSDNIVHPAFDETHTIASATVSLTNSVIYEPAFITVQEIGGTRRTFQQVATVSATGEFSVSGNTLTFDAGDDGTNVAVTYYYKDETGVKVTIDPTVGSVALEIIMSIWGWDPFTGGEPSGDPARATLLHLRSCTLSGDMTLGASLAQEGGVTLPLRVSNKTAGDITMYLPN